MKVSDEEVEIGAQALRATVGARGNNPRPWAALPERLKADYREEARAVLEAVRAASGDH
jgi:hypothetical protein